MKNGTILAIAFLAVTVCSCSDIADDDRLVYVEPAKAEKNVLIEDFTGQKCTNCPKAADAISEIQNVYGDNVIAVAIHSGPFGYQGSAKNAGLKTGLGQLYWDTWFDSSQGQPVAKINRGAKSESYADWGGLVRDELLKQTDVSMEMEVERKGREYKVTVDMLAPKGTEAKLQLWLIEDSIVAMQMMPDGTTDRNYVHNHVLREALNGSWGEDVWFGENLTSRETAFTLDEKYVVDNCRVVAFVYNDKGVLQVNVSRII